MNDQGKKGDEKTRWICQSFAGLLPRAIGKDPTGCSKSSSSKAAASEDPRRTLGVR
jgi:hypothetical protein